MAPDTLSHALAYAARLPGRLLPVVAGGKRPSISDWLNRASREPDTLRDWFDGTLVNIGWTPDPGLLVLDIDTHLDDNGVSGFDTLRTLEARHGTLPATLSATTPTGGRHMLFRCDPTLPVKSIVGGRIGFHGLDIRASSGQIVVAPSVRPEGTYCWDDWDALADEAPTIADAPQWLVHFACGVLRPDGAVVDRRPAQHPASGAASAGGDATRRVPKGARNAALVSEAGALRRRGWVYDAILDALTSLSEAQFAEPCDSNEIAAVARWACGFDPDDDADVTQARGADSWRDMVDAAAGDATAVLDVARQVVADPTLSATETAALLKRCAKGAGVAMRVLQSDLARPIADDEGAPVIEVTRHDFAGSTDSAMRALPQVPGLRVRSGALVEIQDRRIVPIGAPRLAYLLSSAARWRYAEGFGAPDAGVLQAVLAAGHWPGVPTLSGLLQQPAIDPDTGAVIATAGNHAGFEAIFDAGRFPAYEGSGADALAELRGLLTGFPFVSPTDESGALAAILTAAARPLLPTAPGFLVTASEMGTGKSHLARLVTRFACDDAPALRWAQRPEEIDKALLGVLLEGRPVMWFDNMVRDWTSTALATILTERTYGDRILGGNGGAAVSTACIVLGTGNNITPGADLARRVVTIRLDAKCERPELREFAFDPLATIGGERGRWVMAALRVLSDFLQVGHVSRLPPLGSFDVWSRVVRGALVHYGLPDPLHAVSRNVEHDADRDDLGRLLDAWHGTFGDEPLTARQVVAAVQAARQGMPGYDLRCVLEDVAIERHEINLRRLGAWLKTNQGRVVDGRRLGSGGKVRAGVAWQVVVVWPLLRLTT